MSGSTRSRLVVTDANVLINLAHVKRLGLLGSLPGYEFVVPPEVEAEVTAPPQSSALEQAFGSGLVKRRSFTTTEELRLFAEHVKVIGSGEAACLAMAEVHGWYVASDERRKFLRLSIERLGTGRVFEHSGDFCVGYPCSSDNGRGGRKRQIGTREAPVPNALFVIPRSD